MLYKGYIIKSYDKSPNLKVIVTEGRGGKVPDVFLGAHLSDGECMKLIDKYKSKVKTDGKNKTTTSKL
tara:strand:+ start:343 stop:546 length:204 start_codon:yes stop_codon:yes gene_type:complete